MTFNAPLSALCPHTHYNWLTEGFDTTDRISTRNLGRIQRGSGRRASGRASRDPVFGCLQHLSLELVP